LPAEQARQKPGAAGFRKDAAFAEGEGEFRRLTHDANIATDGSVRAVTRRAAIDGADDRRVDVMQNGRRRGAQVDIGRAHAAFANRLLAGSLKFEIEACAERATFAGQDDAADFRIAVGFKQMVGQCAQHWSGNRVHPIRRVQRDGRDMLRNFVEHFIAVDALVHGVSPVLFGKD
jgi:hypothetical protein